MSLVEYNKEFSWILWVAGTFSLFEFFKWAYSAGEWFVGKFGIETKKSRERKEWQKRLTQTEADIKEIKANSDRNVEMFLEHERAVVAKFTDIKDEIVGELGKLHNKIDEQKTESDETDCVMLRDRIASGMRHFSQHKDENGVVHISFSEYVNLDALFQKYFEKEGNGPFKKMYETEFKCFAIDR